MSISRSRLLSVFILICLLVGCAFSEEVRQRNQPKTTPEAPEVKPDLVKPSELKYFVLTPQCFEKIKDGHMDIECIKFAISKLLSYGIIAGSLLYKVPQILKIVKSGSVEGISLSSFYSQLIMAILTIGYNIHLKTALSTYAENLSVFTQTFILILLHWKFNPKTSAACVIASLALFAGLCAVLFLELLPSSLYELIATINIIFLFLAVAPQIKLNYLNKSTGQLAFLTVFLALAGSIGRVFTTLQEVKDPFILGTFLLGTVLNGTVLLQFFIYGGAKKVEPKAKGE